MVFDTFILDVDTYGDAFALCCYWCRFGDYSQAITVFVVRVVGFVRGIFPCRSFRIGSNRVVVLFDMNRPNQSPEPTPIGHRRSAVAGNVTNTARLSFFR